MTGRPTAYDGFEGEVGRIFSTSTPWWPPHPEPPASSPNVIVILLDDLGFSDVGCFGSEIRTPNIDALAAGGVRFTNFHVNPMCSPTRASLLTGLNPHMAGVGHVSHSDPGYPGYAMELRPDAPTVAEMFRDAGWATFAVGKWHLCKDSDLSDAASKHSWPLQVGFDRFFGILDGFTNLHQPHLLYEDNHALDIDEFPDGYFLTDEVTDRAIDMVTRLRMSHPTKPFFMYLAHPAVHAPLHAKAVDMERYRGHYATGWDALREQRLARQQELGVLAEGTELPPRNFEAEHDVRPWDELSAAEQRQFARYQEAYAAMLDNVDQNLGRLKADLEALGEWDNTIVVFTSDNGASREGQMNGTNSYFRTLIGAARNTSEELQDIDLERIDLVGGPQSMPHYPRGWAMASNTPFRLYKVNTRQGGHQVPTIVSWPAGGLDEGSTCRSYQHVTDVMSTLAELVGIEVPDSRHGRPAPEHAGRSFRDALFDHEAESTHSEQYYECWGHRGYYRDGWSATTCHEQHTPFTGERWELHDLRTDPTECHDVADRYPELVAELADAWERAAWANQVFPLDERSMLKETTRPPTEVPLTEGLTVRPGTASLERYRSLKLIAYRSFSVVVALDYADGDQGVLFAHGDQGGGYSMHIEDGHLHLVYNGYGEMTEVDCGLIAPGPHEIVLEVDALAGLRVDLGVRVDTEPRGEVSDLPLLMAMAPFQGIDVGIDRRSPVSWERYLRHGTFPYSGALHFARWEPGEQSPEDPAKFTEFLREAFSKYE
jgi:arylsulfatase A-like enzyme